MAKKSERSSVEDARWHGKQMAFGDYCDGRKQFYHMSPWADAKRKDAYNAGYNAEWDRMVKENGPVVLVDHRGDALYD